MRGTVGAVTSVILGDRECSWDELRSDADDLAAQIAGASTIAVVAEPTTHTVVALLAAMKARVPAVPISADSGDNERAHVLSDSGAQLLLENGAIIELDSPSRIANVDAALVLYTSGTTGPPKGVPITAAAIESCITGLASSWAWTADDLLVHGLPLHHVHGLVLGVLGAMQIDCRLHHTGRPTPAAYAAARGSLYLGVPTVWTRIAKDESAARALASARLLVSGSAALPQGTYDALQRLAGQAPVERYGMTETLITVSARHDAPRSPGMVGTPLAGVQTRIVDEAGVVVPRDGESIGELHVTGPAVFSGYVNRPDATAAAFTSDGWFITGDIASIAAAGGHRIIGRASTDLIKSGGYRIGAGEVEDAILAHPSVSEVAVIGRPDDDLGQSIVAFVVASDVSEAALITHVAERLSWHKRPRQVVFVDALPRNAMGKVEKGRLSVP